MLGREFAALTTRATRRLDIEELRATFATMFRSGIVYAPDEPIPERLDALPSDDKRVAMVEAVAFARELRVPRPRARFQVTAFCEAGELRLIFLVSRRAPQHLQLRWEALIRGANLQAALDLREVEAPSPPRRLQPLSRVGSTLTRWVGGQRRVRVARATSEETVPSSAPRPSVSGTA